MWATWVISPHLVGISASIWYSTLAIGFLPNYSYAEDPFAGVHLECVR